jgi:predicted ArsR family transcriptional regulator
MPHKQIEAGEVTRARILAMMQADPRLTQREIAASVGVTTRTVKRHVAALRTAKDVQP